MRGVFQKVAQAGDGQRKKSGAVNHRRHAGEKRGFGNHEVTKNAINEGVDVVKNKMGAINGHARRSPLFDNVPKGLRCK